MTVRCPTRFSKNINLFGVVSMTNLLPYQHISTMLNLCCLVDMYLHKVQSTNISLNLHLNIIVCRHINKINHYGVITMDTSILSSICCLCRPTCWHTFCYTNINPVTLILSTRVVVWFIQCTS